MRFRFLLTLVALLPTFTALANNVVYIVLDGVRPYEFFKGADPDIPSNKNPVITLSNKEIFPFVWKELAGMQNTTVLGGQGECRVSNPYSVSLPAYADILAGKRQRNVCNNFFMGTVDNPTIPDNLINSKLMDGQDIAVFTSWDRIKYVTTVKEKAGFVTNIGRRTGQKRPPWIFARYDLDTQRSLANYIAYAPKLPKLLFVVYDDSDERGHRNEYRQYLDALKQQDAFIAQIYRYFEAQPFYRGKTTYIITTDHGRGYGKNWANHNAQTPGSEYIWAVISGANPLVGFLETFSCNHINLSQYALRVLLLK